MFNLKHLSRKNNENLFTEDRMDRFDLVSDQKSGSNGTWGVDGEVGHFVVLASY